MMLLGGCENKENLRGAGMNNKLLDFYEFLRGKYGTAARSTTHIDAAKRLCDRASCRAIRLPADYRFDRDEIHER
jgi:hypothetical protein